ncbi:zinc finger protein 883-like [Ostrinia nubilalis]|uniref:zinc finger protein 883-like n=1 Tax=Ostrinia nubilalis TaxID=29057 RepID=UPI0030826241
MAALSKWVPVGMASDQPQFNHLKLTTIDKIGGIYCRICHTKFGNKKEYDTHYLKHDTGSKDITYTCVVCYKDIVGYPSFRGHCYTIHVMKDKFRCTHCNKQFSKQTALVSHYESLHQFKCSTCHVRFQSQKDLAMHQICHKNEQCNPPYNCQICNKQIEDTNDCEQHIEDHCSISYFCPICDEGINEIQNATSHLAKHFGDVLIEDNESNSDSEGQEFSNDSSIDILGGIFCSICKKTYKARPDFDNHFMLEHDDKKIIYGCNICAKEYDKYFVFANHCYNHYTKDKFQCEVCFKSFPRLSLLVIHMEAHSRTRDGGFQCLQCGHALQTARRLRDHYKTEHDICYSQCPEEGCGKIFATPKELVLHRKEHAGGNWCQQCGLRFASLAACLKHVPVHRKKRYSCPVCKRCYGEKYLLMKHVTQHFSAVLHVCKICGKVYSHRHRLMQHMKVHNEAKEHACAICGKGFAKLYLLKQHQNIHFNSKPYKCSNCPKTFASVPNLRKHMKKIHNVTQITFNHYEKPAETSNEKLDVSNPSSSEMSVDAPTSLEESDESCGWRADDTLDELMTLEELDPLETRAEEISEIEADLWVPSPMMPTATPVPLPASVPCEYGPELVPLDEHCLPHAPPQLVTQPRWPPVLTKLADCAYADLAYADLAEVMNADIY